MKVHDLQKETADRHKIDWRPICWDAASWKRRAVLLGVIWGYLALGGVEEAWSQDCPSGGQVCISASTASSLDWGQGGVLFQGDVRGILHKARLKAQARQLELRSVGKGKGVRLRFNQQVQLQGEQPLMRLQAEWVSLQLGDNGQLKEFHAGGEVRLDQTARTLYAQELHTSGDLQLLVLQGNARVENGGNTLLNGERLEVKLSQDGGVEVRQPSRLARLNLDATRFTRNYGLQGDTLRNLAQNVLPPRVAAKLAPLAGKFYPEQQTFVTAARNLLTAQEALQYIDLIENAARQP